MTESDIRTALRTQLHAKYANRGKTLILDELGVFGGRVRADIAVVNGSLAAFEIKSAQDTLRRLKSQAAAYNRVFDQVTLVVDADHLKTSSRHVPKWWGIFVPTLRKDGRVAFQVIRKAQANAKVDPKALARLLWRDEVIAALSQRSLITPRDRRLPRAELWSILAEGVALDVLRRTVRNQLRARTRWRSASGQMKDGERFQPGAKL